MVYITPDFFPPVGLKRLESGDREQPSEPKKMKTRGRGFGGGGTHENGEWVLGDDDDDEEEDEEPGYDAAAAANPSDADLEAAARRQGLVKRTIQEMVRSRRVGETFLQDGPCYQVSFLDRFLKEGKKLE
jgi:hypothetical protein